MTSIRPILMHERSMRGILAGRKTQTRRVVKGLPEDTNGALVATECEGDTRAYAVPVGEDFRDLRDPVYCPYGDVGDLLWARETFQLPERLDDSPPREADPRTPVRYTADGAVGNCPHPEPPWGRKRPSIHMPKWACRAFLPITDVRVERVQDISYEDILAEGVQELVLPEHEGPGIDHDGTMDEWRRLWTDTNGSDAWDQNDWCWVIEWDQVSTVKKARDHVGEEVWREWLG